MNIKDTERVKRFFKDILITIVVFFIDVFLEKLLEEK